MASEERIGHRDLTEDQIKLIQEARDLGKSMDAFIKKLNQTADFADKRWIAIGATDLQKGLMSIVRGIANPDFF